jgi:hypothetical protein
MGEEIFFFGTAVFGPALKHRQPAIQWALSVLSLRSRKQEVLALFHSESIRLHGKVKLSVETYGGVEV